MLTLCSGIQHKTRLENLPKDTFVVIAQYLKISTIYMLSRATRALSKSLLDQNKSCFSLISHVLLLHHSKSCPLTCDEYRIWKRGLAHAQKVGQQVIMTNFYMTNFYQHIHYLDWRANFDSDPQFAFSGQCGRLITCSGEAVEAMEHFPHLESVMLKINKTRYHGPRGLMYVGYNTNIFIQGQELQLLLAAMKKHCDEVRRVLKAHDETCETQATQGRIKKTHSYCCIS